jgi:hypothetical protein
MNGKIPIGRTISSAYAFAFSNFLSILGIVWFPYLAFAVIAIGLVLLIMPNLLQMIMAPDLDISAWMSFARIAALLWLLGLVVGAMTTVGLQRKALGLHPRPVYLFFSLGAAVWRMAVALFLAVVVIFLIALIATAACVAIWFVAAPAASGAWLIRALAIFSAVAFVAYVAVRLMFFLPAVVVAEERIGIERAWSLSGRNFWRIFLVWIAVVAPVAIVFHILSSAIFGSFGGWPAMRQAMTMHEILRDAVMQFRAVGPLVLAIQFIERLVLLGVANGAIAAAYLAVTGTGVSHGAGQGAPAAPAA